MTGTFSFCFLSSLFIDPCGPVPNREITGPGRTASERCGLAVQPGNTLSLSSLPHLVGGSFCFAAFWHIVVWVLDKRELVKAERDKERIKPKVFKAI